MNVCYDCNSSYEKPGTCNCFAPGGKRALRLFDSAEVNVTPQPIPWVPQTAPLPLRTITVPAVQRTSPVSPMVTW